MPRLLAPALIGVLLMTSLSAVLDTDAAGFSNVQTSVITVKEKETPCDGPVIDAELVVKDQAGNVIRQTTVGTQVLIEGSVIMDCFQYPDDSQTVIFEVRDEQGITNYLAWQIISEDSVQIAAGVSWTPDKPGNYEVRFFPLVCLSCPMVLSKVVTYEITVI